mmetsp:Transcript_23694/g.82422  ORF Transcript_23694/g.82422 Transcript_23694/m.82422 type:complete len:355 (-) Transcript_23694:67-1131(-)
MHRNHAFLSNRQMHSIARRFLHGRVADGAPQCSRFVQERARRACLLRAAPIRSTVDVGRVGWDGSGWLRTVAACTGPGRFVFFRRIRDGRRRARLTVATVATASSAPGTSAASTTSTTSATVGTVVSLALTFTCTTLGGPFIRVLRLARQPRWGRRLPHSAIVDVSLRTRRPLPDVPVFRNTIHRLPPPPELRAVDSPRLVARCPPQDLFLARRHDVDDSVLGSTGKRGEIVTNIWFVEVLDDVQAHSGKVVSHVLVLARIADLWDWHSWRRIVPDARLEEHTIRLPPLENILRHILAPWRRFPVVDELLHFEERRHERVFNIAAHEHVGHEIKHSVRIAHSASLLVAPQTLQV